ncbi:uracil-DNA glycosylase [Yoonia vestfoldensis]|uniref:Uracil-DNA glycosylase n=1 Tax=Yoonia vestfoldensis SKA53 TaxID=314232 RepID=A3V4C6_9RHOB|nr:uracil-DNA glycosylase [Yoonia vestfoldensis]EAQ07333.1 uracil-DNA glycosylase [Yoonia vestfoldensis SKA53]
MFDLSRLGDWADLPFFRDDLPILAGRIGADILPPPALTFTALARCQPAATRVVILGQDPYHTPDKADGLAFSINPAFTGNLASLGNIFKEIQSDTGQSRNKTNLHDWADQGVLLLNTALSVAPGRAGAHGKIGWSRLVHQVLARLNDHPRAFILWGAQAQAYAARLPAHHLLLTSAHPSPLSAHRGFFGSRPFSKVNQWLMDRGDIPINWAAP